MLELSNEKPKPKIICQMRYIVLSGNKMNREKFVLLFYRERGDLYLKEKGFFVLAIRNVTKIEKGEGLSNGNVLVFLKSDETFNIWDVKVIEEL